MSASSVLPALVLVTFALTGCAASEPGSAPENDQQFYDDYVARTAEYFGIENPPEVEIVKWIKPEDLLSYSDPCVVAQGFTQLKDSSWDVPAEQDSAFKLAQYICWAKYPPLPRYSAPWTDQQRGIQYDWTVDDVIPCLEEHGYAISDPPSRQTFIDTYDTDPFYPFAQLPESLTNAQWNQLETDCPQIAPSDVLFD